VFLEELYRVIRIFETLKKREEETQGNLYEIEPIREIVFFSKQIHKETYKGLYPFFVL
jgi:hypothetical protein